MLNFHSEISSSLYITLGLDHEIQYLTSQVYKAGWNLEELIEEWTFHTEVEHCTQSASPAVYLYSLAVL